MVESGEKTTSQESEEKKELRLEIRIDAERYQRFKSLARYAAVEGIIPDDHRGNLTAWVIYCLAIGDELLTKHAQKKRGF